MALNTKFTWAILLGLSMAVAACDDKTDDTGGDVTDGGSSDGGSSDGGSSDGGAGDGGSDCDTGFAVVGYYGGATVTDGTAYENGWEDFYIVDLATGEDICRVASYVSDEGARDDCEACDWAFDLKSYDSFYQNDTEEGCTLYGVVASDYDDAEWSYGFASTWSYEYYGYEYTYYDVLMFTSSYYENWYGITWASTSWDGETFGYDWPGGYNYTYSDGCF